MKVSLNLSRQLFLECQWTYETSPDEIDKYYSIMQSLEVAASSLNNLGKIDCAEILKLLARISSMQLSGTSLNEPFMPMMRDFEKGRRTLLPEDLTLEEVSFLEDILDDVNEPYLKARIADLIWLLRKPRIVNYAKIAIDTYIALANCIDDDSWYKGLNVLLERAARLCIQIKDYDRLEKIKTKLFSIFLLEYPNSKFMNLSIADLMSKLKIDNDIKEDIATRLYEKGKFFKEERDFLAARSYFELASKKYQQCSDDKKHIDSLVEIAESFEQEANELSASSYLVADALFENAIQAYRRIPVKYRTIYGIEDKISLIRNKKMISGKASVDEMAIFKTDGIDISDIVKSSIDHVSGKDTLQETLTYFISVSSGVSYHKIVDDAKSTLDNNFLRDSFSGVKKSSDGRVVAKIPAMNRDAGEDDPANKAVLNSRIYEHFSIRIQLVVQGQILPALRQLCMEHRFNKDCMVAVCLQSQLVPEGRENLLGHALWLGIEEEFGAAIHLLCPQVEHIVRTELKKVGAHTTTIDSNGIENENGLSTLMELPEVEQIFGKSLAFEIRSIFTESLGSNLRNEVAHGLLDDNSSSSIYTVYAWWMILRLVILSIINVSIKRD
jgi:hypothetical protein